jgi:pSer/pThr/pTyr-binding forkhead associated (FHA) protein
MAARLILSMDGAVLKEYALNKERMTVGRKPHNDIVIDNLAVSSEHAAIVTILNDSFLEDLDSTNGVTVNGVAIKKHFLQNNDVIEIGKYTLKYINEQPAQRAESAEEDFEKTMVMRAPARQPQAVPPPPPAAPQLAAEPARTTVGVKPAAIQILSGPNAGRELDLVKNLTTLGRTGVQVAVLTRRPHSYFITHVEGANYPLLNGRALNDQPHPLNNHDIIELAGVKMEFYFKE